MRAAYREFTPESDAYLCGILTNVEFDPETADGGAPFTALYDERGIAYVEISRSSYRTDIGLSVGDSRRGRADAIRLVEGCL